MEKKKKRRKEKKKQIRKGGGEKERKKKKKRGGWVGGGGGGGGGRRPVLGQANLPPSCVEYLEAWEPQPPATIRASRGLYRDFFAFNIFFFQTKHARRV